MAISLGNKEIINYLLELGADVNTQDIEGDTPLHYAVKEMKYELLAELIKAGANPRIWNKKNRLPDFGIPLYIRKY